MKHTDSYNQLINDLRTEKQKTILTQTLEPLNEQAREDFCLATVAYLRLGIRRSFSNPVMQVLFSTYCDMLRK